MDLQTLLDEEVRPGLRRIVISGARNSGGVTKVRIRPVLLRGEVYYQCQETRGAQEFHRNLTREEVIAQILAWMEQDFKQLQLEAENSSASVLVSKKGKVTIKRKAGSPDAVRMRPAGEAMLHNRKKRYLLEEGRPVEFLQDLGIMTGSGKIVQSRYSKFRQINRFLEFIEDILPQLPRDRELTVLDFGCGKSYLTFAMYYYLRELAGLDVRIIGLDLKEDVIRNCGELAVRYGYEKLSFQQGDIASYEGVDAVDLVVTLHACDTATDYALARAVAWNAKVILPVPCCQHELNRQIRNDVLAPVLEYGIIKERMAALMTDALRAKLLECAGYETQILEFIDMEHTPKNLLIRAVKRREGSGALPEDVRACMEQFHVKPTLALLLAQEGDGI